MSDIRIGVFGASRGNFVSNFAYKTHEAKLVAVCDMREELLEDFKKKPGVTCYTSFDDFINHDMDAVVIANYANEHAPYAIRCLNKGLHVLSEVLPAYSLKEAVELVEAVERSGCIYSYAENYCYMPATLEFKSLYQSNKLGVLEYAEGEYIHNCEPIWADITYGDKNHWRNNMSCNFYCSHSIGPIIHATKLKPISVVGFEVPYSPRIANMGAKFGAAGIEMITLENGAIIRSTHGNLAKNSIWFSMYGTKGRVESAREGTNSGDMLTVYKDLDKTEVVSDGKLEVIHPEHPLSKKAKGLGHNDSDYYPMHYFIEAIKGNKDADIIDVYEAMDMSIIGILAYYSVLDGNKPYHIPNLRIKEERDLVRNDDRKVGRDLPSYSRTKIEIDDIIYEKLRNKYIKNLKEKNK